MDKGITKAWRLVFFGMVMIILGSLVAALPIFRGLSYTAMLLGELMILVPVLCGVHSLKKAGISPDFGTLRFSPRLLLPLFFLPICMQQFCALFMTPFLQILNEWMGELPDSIQAADSVVTFLMQFLVVCVAAPVVEEFFCRGLLFQLVRPYGAAAMIFVPALGFSLMHFDLRQIPVIFMLGLLLSVVRLMTRSIGASIYVHACNNFMTLILMLAERHLPEEAIGALAILGMLLFPVLLCLFLKLLRSEDAPLCEPGSLKIKLTPMAVVCFGLVAVYNALLLFQIWF